MISSPLRSLSVDSPSFTPLDSLYSPSICPRCLLDFRGIPKLKTHVQVLYLGSNGCPLLLIKAAPRYVTRNMIANTAAGIQSGEDIHIQDQLMAPVSLRTTKTTVRITNGILYAHLMICALLDILLIRLHITDVNTQWIKKGTIFAFFFIIKGHKGCRVSEILDCLLLRLEFR